MEIKTISFSANDQVLTKESGSDNFVSNAVSYVKAEFSLGTGWTRADYNTVNAVWHSVFATISTVLDANNSCMVPVEMLAYNCDVYVNLVGTVVEDDTVSYRLTTEKAKAFAVNKIAEIEGSETTEITPSQFEQFVNEVRAEAEAIDNYTYDSEAWAKGTRAGVPVASTDPTYHNNSKYYADQGAALEQEVTDLKSELNDEIVFVLDKWEQGGIDYSSGAETSSTTACRTVGYFSPKENTILFISNPSSQAFGLRAYNSSGTYVESTNIADKKTVTLIGGYRYRVVCPSTGEPTSVTATFSYYNTASTASVFKGLVSTIKKPTELDWYVGYNFNTSTGVLEGNSWVAISAFSVEGLVDELSLADNTGGHLWYAIVGFNENWVYQGTWNRETESFEKTEFKIKDKSFLLTTITKLFPSYHLFIKLIKDNGGMDASHTTSVSAYTIGNNVIGERSGSIIKWINGNYNAIDGSYSADPTAIVTANYVPDFIKAIVSTKRFRVHVWGEDGTYAGTVGYSQLLKEYGWKLEYSKVWDLDAVRTFLPNCKIKIIAYGCSSPSEANNFQLYVDQIDYEKHITRLESGMGRTYSYTGERMPTQIHTYDFDWLVTFTGGGTPQDMETFGNYLFVAYDEDYIKVYSLTDYSLITTISVETLHGNGIQFSSEYYDESDSFPLLYVGGSNNRFNVIRIGNDWTVSIIRTLKLPTTDGYMLSPCIDVEHNVLYSIGYSENSLLSANNNMVILSSDLSELTENEDETYTPKTIRKIVAPYIGVEQGHKFLMGRIFCIISNPSAPHNTCLKVIDADGGEVITSIELAPIRNVEGEGICFKINNNVIEWFVSSSAVYKLDL